jgi:hypothetical protein
LGGAGTQDVPPGLHRTLGDDLHKGKALMGQSLLKGSGERLRMGCGAAADHGGPRRDSDLAAVQRFFEVAVRGGLGPRPHLRAGSDLPPGHGIDLIVDHDDGDVDVPAGGVEQVEPPDSQTVPVSREDDDLAGRPSGFQPDGGGDGAAVKNLEDIGVDVNGDPGAAADAGGQGQIVDNSQVIHGFQEGLDNHSVAAAWTKEKRKKILPEVFFAEWIHRFSSRNRRNSCGCG